MGKFIMFCGIDIGGGAGREAADAHHAKCKECTKILQSCLPDLAGKECWEDSPEFDGEEDWEARDMLVAACA